MSKSFRSRRLCRVLATESLEPRALLDAALGGEFAQFTSQAELQSHLVDQAVERYEHLFGQPTWGWAQPGHWRWGEFCPACSVLPTFDATATPEGPGAGGTALDYSDTYTQVAGVDEGDIIETDGQHVYLLSDNQLTIVDVSVPEHPRTASRVDLGDEGYAREIYLDGDRLLVLSTDWNYFVGPWIGGGGAPLAELAIDVAMPYQSHPRVIATVLDVTDREEPFTVGRTEIDGNLSASRAIDGNAYLVMQDYLDYPYPQAESNQTDPDAEPDRGKPTHTYETEASYRARVEGMILDVLPGYQGFDRDGEEVASGSLTEPTDIYRPEKSQSADMLSIVTIDMHADLPGPHEVTSVMASSGHEIYMSADNLYLFQPKWGRSEETSIVKFEMDPWAGAVEPVASGVVPGRMLNQFSADEYQPYLRVATTQGWGRDSTNGVYVLDQDGSNLEIVGSVEDMAPGENIFSVRFLNYRAYVVTFERVDPLFALNLADPANPRIEGELKITGFSDHLLPVGENHLLGIGRDADEQTGRVGNLQVSLFDVTDMTNPKLADRYSFPGTMNMWSPAESDHHAIGYYPSFEILALPVSRRSGWISDTDGERIWNTPKIEHALHVFRVDVDSGIELLGNVEHPSEVRRSVRVGESLISASFDTLKINPIEDPGLLLGQLHYLPPGGAVDPPVAEDIDLLFREASTNANRTEFDRDGNALVNRDDVEFVVHAVLQTKFGDSDLDGNVDFADFLNLASNFGNEGGWADGDFDGDGRIGFGDFSLLTKNFGA